MIDWDRVAELRNEIGADDFEEVVDLFLHEVDEEIEKLALTAPGGALSEKLHFLKGSALSLGFREFSTLCETGELALSADPAAPVDLDRLHASYASSRKAFLAELSRMPASQSNR